MDSSCRNLEPLTSLGVLGFVMSEPEPKLRSCAAGSAALEEDAPSFRTGEDGMNCCDRVRGCCAGRWADKDEVLRVR